MPFYPSPLRDGGYDISDYRNVDPTYGTLDDFKRLLEEAHARGLRVVTELVINHTSDQHPWFQRARSAPPGSPERDFYVWSDTTEKFRDARIIFIDTETSNWTWDPVAQSYFWHRFYSHQPDLNYDNPRVMAEVLEVLRFWLDMGVDGVRLDAIPYLIERDGTTCENLPETHAAIKSIRAMIDAEYPDRLMLAEANQWPEDTAAYFAEGDECQMAFHFPLMPRMYMALAQEDRHPISDIMRQTPEIPANCQWGIFLRNHDELTLEMVTDRDRDYLWSFYATDNRMRSNLGIRRRLAPLLENDRRRIEFMMQLLLSFPGTPFLYYGDEIGMGDNIYLGDRDGVRTPMQWSPDRNGGFSRAHPGRMFLPVNQDTVYGSDVVNVEAQIASPFSLLNWTRRMVMLRRRHQAVFARGTLRFLYPRNRKVLAYLRELGSETILCVANVSRTPQAVELDLSQFDGFTPTEMTGETMFPPIGALPYLLTLTAYGVYWFRLALVQEDQSLAPPAPELFTLVQGATPQTLLLGRELKFLEEQALPRFLAGRAWYPRGASDIAGVRLRASVRLPSDTLEHLGLAIFDVTLTGGGNEACLLPLALLDRETDELLPDAVARVRKFNRVGLLVDAHVLPSFASAVVSAASAGWSHELPDGGTLHFTGTEDLAEQLAAPTIEEGGAPSRLDGEFASTIAVSQQLTLRLYRRPTPGPCGEIEVARLLWATGYRNVPRAVGALSMRGTDGAESVLVGLFGFVRHQGTARLRVAEALRRDLETVAEAPEDVPLLAGDMLGPVARYAQVIGARLAELHHALSDAGVPALKSETYREDDFARLRGDLLHAIAASFTLLRHRPGRAAGRLLARQQQLLAKVGDVAPMLDGLRKGIVHGQMTLARALIVQDDVVLSSAGRGSSGMAWDAKRLTLLDLASLMHSLAVVVDEAVEAVGRRHQATAARLPAWAEAWRTQFRDGVFAGYAEAGGALTRDGDLFRVLLLARAMEDLPGIALHHPERLDWLDRHIAGLLDGDGWETRPV
jgi:maltose alpha-D-glucosyltransferase/alpha-amylase